MSGATTTALGATAAVGIAAAAWRARSLDAAGAVAAVVLGTLAAAAGAGWAALLVAYFVTSAALSRLGRTVKAARTSTVVAKGGARDARQVLANGGVFGGCAAGALFWPDAAWGAAAAGALAASAADTWATEIGTWVGGAPRHVLTWRRLEVGMSGGVTWAGSAAMLAGAVAIAAAARSLGVASAVAAVAAGGVAGAMTDSIAGATAQERRRCLACGAATEQDPHQCGGATRIERGVAGIGNDLVNLVATITGAAVAAWAASHIG